MMMGPEPMISTFLMSFLRGIEVSFMFVRSVKKPAQAGAALSVRVIGKYLPIELNLV